MLPLRTIKVFNIPAVNTCFPKKFLSSYKSSQSLHNLYPKSSLSIAAPVEIPESSGSKFSGFIPIEKLEITYSRSSGPGGQHVNTTDTKVDVRFHVESASWLQKEVKESLAKMYKSRVTKEGYFVVRSDKTRSQMYNQADALSSLRHMIRTAATPAPSPSEETLHAIRKRKEKANIERLMEKKMHSQKKASRRDANF